MTRKLNRRTTLGAALFLAAASLAAAQTEGPRIGAPAPAFTAVDTAGKSHSLAEYQGKTVVLEWTNHECPYVRKHYGGEAMQALQRKWTGEGVVWLTIISSAPGEQGNVSPEAADKLTADRKAAPSAVLLDPKGEVGRAYGARVTPHTYVITADGTLAFMGGIDDKPTSKLEDLKTAKNFVDAALTEVTQGKPVSVPTARPYGCTIKYVS